MGKQKLEIKVPVLDERKKSKVMQIIAKQSGILSITVDREKDKVTVVGNESMDVTCLTMVLRKQLHTHVIIDTVTQVDEKKEKEEKERKKMEEECRNLYWYNTVYRPYPLYPHPLYEVGDQTSSAQCCQM